MFYSTRHLEKTAFKLSLICNRLIKFHEDISVPVYLTITYLSKEIDIPSDNLSIKSYNLYKN